MKIKKWKLFVAGIVFLLILAGAALFVGFAPVFNIKIEYDDTSEHSATVNTVELDGSLYKIDVVEYPCAVTVYKGEVIDENSLNELSAGDTITFYIPKFYEDLLTRNDVKSVRIVSLKTENTVIVSLDSHNEMENRGVVEVRITAIVSSVLFIAGAAACLGCLIKLKKTNRCQ